MMAISALCTSENFQYLSLTFDEKSEGFCVGRDWQVVFVVKLRQQCVGGRRFYLIQCWGMGRINPNSNTLLLWLVEDTPSEQLKLSESTEVLGSLGQHPRRMPTAYLKNIFYVFSAKEKKGLKAVAAEFPELCISIIQFELHINEGALKRGALMSYHLYTRHALYHAQYNHSIQGPNSEVGWSQPWGTYFCILVFCSCQTHSMSIQLFVSSNSKSLGLTQTT